MGVGQREKATQKRVIKLFAQELGYTYLGDFTERKNSNIETELLTKFLARKGYSSLLISRALKELQDAAGDQSVNLYDLNEQTYKKLRYGVKVSESVGQHKITVQGKTGGHDIIGADCQQESSSNTPFLIIEHQTDTFGPDKKQQQACKDGGNFEKRKRQVALSDCPDQQGQ